MKRVVLDASAAVRLVMRGEGAAGIAAVVAGASIVLAPELFCTEVANALRKYVGAGELDRDEGLARLDDALGLVDTITPDRTMVLEVLAEAIARDHPVYDLAYAVLARRQGARLLTADTRLAEIARLMGVPAADIR